MCNLLVQLLLAFARAVTLGYKSRRTYDHILLSHMRLPRPGGPCLRIYIPQGDRDYGRRGSSALTMRHPSIRKSWH
jgi:hypothetical protein